MHRSLDLSLKDYSELTSVLSANPSSVSRAVSSRRLNALLDSKGDSKIWTSRRSLCADLGLLLCWSISQIGRLRPSLPLHRVHRSISLGFFLELFRCTLECILRLIRSTRILQTRFRSERRVSLLFAEFLAQKSSLNRLALLPTLPKIQQKQIRRKKYFRISC